MTPEQQWDKKIFENIDIPQMDTTMNAHYTEGEDIGKAIIEEFFQKTRLTQKQPGHRLWINNKEVQQPPDLDNAGGEQQEEQQTLQQDTIQPPPGLDLPEHNYIHPTPKSQGRPDNYKPPQVDRQTITSNRSTV
eukprot:3068574-Amphidinium_carterae.6